MSKDVELTRVAGALSSSVFDRNCGQPAQVLLEEKFIHIFACLECFEILKTAGVESLEATRLVQQSDGEPSCKVNRTLWSQLAEAAELERVAARALARAR